MPGRRRERSAPASSFHPWSNTTCALDVAEQIRSEEEIAEALGISTRQVRRILSRALAKLDGNPDAAAINDLAEGR